MNNILKQFGNVRFRLRRGDEVIREWTEHNTVEDLMIENEMTYLANDCTTEPVKGIVFVGGGALVSVEEIVQTSIDAGGLSDEYITWLASWTNGEGETITLTDFALLNSKDTYSSDTIYSSLGSQSVAVTDGTTLDVYWTHTFAEAIITSGSGATASTSGYVLTDTSKSWTPDAYIGRKLLYSGTYYSITDNNATTITVSTSLGTHSSVTYSVTYGTTADFLSYMSSCFASSISTSPIKIFRVTLHTTEDATYDIKPTVNATTNTVTWTATATNSNDASGTNGTLTNVDIGTLALATTYFNNYPYPAETWNSGASYTLTFVISAAETA